MKFVKGFSVVVSLFLLTSCIKHEIIPPPTKTVDLHASFIGIIQGATYEIIKDYNGYKCEADDSKELNTAPVMSSVVYYSTLISSQKVDFIRLEVGRLLFNKDNDIKPTLLDFDTFFREEPDREFSDNAEEGVRIIFQDGDGRKWVSDPTAEGNSFTFSKLSQESDETGDYMKYTARFEVTLFLDVDFNHPDYGQTITIQNGIMQGFFKN